MVFGKPIENESKNANKPLKMPVLSQSNNLLQGCVSSLIADFMDDEDKQVEAPNSSTFIY